MRSALLLLCLATCAAMLAQGGTGHAQTIDPEADRLLREMGEYLSTAQEFTFGARVAYDTVTEEGQKLRFGGVLNLAVKRPDRLRGEVDGDERHHLAVYDGRTITIHDLATNLYATTDVPPTIDGALDSLFERFGFGVPVSDFVYANPYGTLIANVRGGYIVGQHPVDGVMCHHLAFTQESIDWQIWIEVGPQPVPRRILIDYKEEPGSPQYGAQLSDWDFQPRLADHYFDFHPPPGSHEIEFLNPLETVPPEESRP